MNEVVIESHLKMLRFLEHPARQKYIPGDGFGIFRSWGVTNQWTLSDTWDLTSPIVTPIREYLIR